MNTLKYNRFTAKLVRGLFRLLCGGVDHFVFVATTGRSGSHTLQVLSTAMSNTYACHEDHPILNKQAMIEFNQLSDERMKLEFNSRKLLKIILHVLGKSNYVETNHMFIKCFADEAYRVFGDRLRVIELSRDSEDVALSIFNSGAIPGSELGNKWYLDPRAPRNVIQIAGDLYGDGRFRDDYYKCLWYWYEIKARTSLFKRQHPCVKIAELATENLNDFDKVRKTFVDLDLQVNDAQLKTLVGTRANASRNIVKEDVSFIEGGRERLNEFHQLCQACLNQ